MLIFLLPIFFIVSLFILYVISKNDFIFLRKNVSIHNMFDTVLISFIGFLLMGRIFYVFGGLHTMLMNPITFFHIFRFPGLLYLGGILGFAGIVFLRLRKKKVILHIFDVYALALYPIFLFALLASNMRGNFLYFNLSILVLSLFFFSLGIYSYKNYVLKDGSISLLFLSLISIFTIINEFASSGRIILSFFTIPQIISVVVFFAAGILLLIHESLITFKKR